MLLRRRRKLTLGQVSLAVAYVLIVAAAGAWLIAGAPVTAKILAGLAMLFVAIWMMI